MSRLIDDLEKQLMQLEPSDRAMLAQRLIESLDTADEATNERLWAEEAERRYQEYVKGKVKAIPADEVLRNVRARLK